MRLEIVLLILILANSIVIVIGVSTTSFMITRLWSQFGLITDLKQNIAELTKVIEQQTRLLEYFAHKN